MSGKSIKIRLLFVTLAVPGCILADEPGGAKHSVAQESVPLLRKVFSYQPKVGKEMEVIEKSRGEIVRMDAFTVVDSLRQRELNEKLEDESRKKKNEAFSFTKGGAIYKNSRIEIGAWGDRKGITILKISR